MVIGRGSIPAAVVLGNLEVPGVEAVLAPVDRDVAGLPAELGWIRQQVGAAAAVDAGDDPVGVEGIGEVVVHGPNLPPTRDPSGGRSGVCRPCVGCVGAVARCGGQWSHDVALRSRRDTVLMRVVAGTHRGRRIVAPSGSATRPTGDRVREAVFNALTSGGWVDGDLVADLFAGSGALGIEALSRGATHCWFVDDAATARRAITTNLGDLGLAERGEVVTSSLPAALAGLPTGLGVVFADPPYAFDDWATLLDALASQMTADGVVVVESDRSIELPERWEKMRERTYGGTVITFAAVAVDHHTSNTSHNRHGRDAAAGGDTA